MHTQKKKIFKICPGCGHEWSSRADFLEDPNIVPVGYQVHFKELTAGIFLFNHSCKTTLSVQVDGFTDLYDGPVFSARATGNEACAERCLREDDLESCQEECECAYVREVLQIIREWPKKIIEW